MTARKQESPDGPRQLRATGMWHQLASALAGTTVGLLIGLSSFGAAFLSADSHYIVSGVTADTLLVLLFLSLVVGCIARKYWLWSFFSQLVGLAPGVFFLMLGEPQTTLERLSIPAVLALVSLVGIFLGSALAHAAARLRNAA